MGPFFTFWNESDWFPAPRLLCPQYMMVNPCRRETRGLVMLLRANGRSDWFWIKAGLVLWACVRSSGGYEKAKERRILGEHIFAKVGRGSLAPAPLTSMLLDSGWLRAPGGAKGRVKRGSGGPKGRFYLRACCGLGWVRLGLHSGSWVGFARVERWGFLLVRLGWRAFAGLFL